MKVKSSNYHSSTANSAARHQIHQPVLSSSHGPTPQGHYVVQNQYKEKSSSKAMSSKQVGNSAQKQQTQGLSSSQHHQGPSLQQQQQQQQHGHQPSYTHHQSNANMNQQFNINNVSASNNNGQGQMTLQELQSQPQQMQQTPSQGQKQVKTVNLSFAGQEFQHRNMASSMHNGFYVNSAAIDEVNTRQKQSNKHPQQQQQQQQMQGQVLMASNGGEYRQTAAAAVQYQSNQNQGNLFSGINYIQAIDNTGSVRSLGIGQRQPQVGASMQNVQGAPSIQQQSQMAAMGNFTQTAQGVINNNGNFLNVHNTPGQKKNVSSKNQQRRKISATNQSTQFHTSGNQLLQSTINYPQTIKKKSSKAKMLVSGVIDPSNVSNQQLVSAFPGGASSHHNSMSMTRTQQGNKMMQQTGFKQRAFNEPSEDLSPVDNNNSGASVNNVFMQDSRLSNTLNRGYHQQMQGVDGNIFNQATLQEVVAQNAVQQQVAYSGNAMHGYIASKQIQGQQTPSGYRQVSMISSQNVGGQAQQPTEAAAYAFITSGGDPNSVKQSQQQFVVAGGGNGSNAPGSLISSSNGNAGTRSKTMNTATALQMLQPGQSLHQSGVTTAAQQHHLIQSVQASAKLNKNYLKAMPQYDAQTQSYYSKSQQRSYQSLQAQQLSLLNQANPANNSNAAGPSPQPGSITGSQQLVGQQPGSQQQAFVYGRKLVQMKNPGDPSAQILSEPLSASLHSSQGPKLANQIQMQTVYQRHNLNSQNGLQPGEIQIQRTTSVPPQFEMGSSDQQFQHLESLQLQKLHSINSGQKQPIVLNQAQIQYVTRDGQQVEMTQSQQQHQAVFSAAQSSSKNTNLIVRIDNSSAGNHQITKRKRLKDGVQMGSTVLRNGQAAPGAITGEQPSETDLMSEAGHSVQRPALFVENMDQQNQINNGFATEQDAFSIVPNAIKDTMANSQQNFNPKSLNMAAGRNGTQLTADNQSLDGRAVSNQHMREGNVSVTRNADGTNSVNKSAMGKPASAVVNKRAISLQVSSNQGAGALTSQQQQQQLLQRPDSKQGQVGQHISAKKKFDQELAARDALIGIDDEDEAVDHHQDFSENEGESHQSKISDGDVSHDELQLHYNKSVDSDKIGKSGSLSYRQGAGTGLKQNAPSSTLQAVSTAGNSSNVTGGPAYQAQAHAISDTESELSSSAHQHQMFVYNNSSAAQGSNQRDPNASLGNMAASDSETDGNFSDTGSCFGRGTTMGVDGQGGPNQHDDIDGISEHSSDEADSDSEELLPNGKKKEKIQGEKPVKRKKKKVNQDEKGNVPVKKSKAEKENVTTQKKGKEKSNVAPAKKNFTEVKEKEYNAKVKQKEAPGKNKNMQQPSKDGSKKPDKNQEKPAKNKDNDSGAPPKVKKVKAPEESKGGAAAATELTLKESPMKKKPKQKLNLALVHTQPKNIEEQRDLFFESNCTQNPVFEYENYAATQKFLAQFKEPSNDLLELSVKILDSFIEIYGSESAYLETEGEIVSREETLEMFTDYLEALSFEELLTINFKANQVAPTSVTHDPKTGKSRVNIRDPPEYRRGRLYGVIDHEIGTHFMRKFNERLQPWHKKRDKFELKSCIQTEEGFACVNQLVRTAWDGKHPFLYRSALNYYAAFMASKYSFVELFNDIEKYIDSRASRWKFVLRLKRGLIETCEPGGLYKDQCYLEGAVEFLQNRNNIDIIGLFTGKISMDDLNRPKIQKVLNKEGIKLPTFVQDMDKYMAALDIIARTNLIATKPAE